MDYQLKPIGKTCAATGDEIEPGSRCHSVLVEQDGKLVRLDYSEQGWSGPPADALGHWCCVAPERPHGKTKSFDPEDLLRYFEQLTEDANPAHDKFRYVLALLLLQKRRLKLDGSRSDEGFEYLELSGSRGEGPYEVRDQQLTEDEVNQLQAGLNEHLEAEWN